MTDYREIQAHIYRARLARNAMLGELIADGIVGLWTALKRLAVKVAAYATALKHGHIAPVPHR